MPLQEVCPSRNTFYKALFDSLRKDSSKHVQKSYNAGQSVVGTRLVLFHDICDVDFTKTIGPLVEPANDLLYQIVRAYHKKWDQYPYQSSVKYIRLCKYKEVLSAKIIKHPDT